MWNPIFHDSDSFPVDVTLTENIASLDAQKLLGNCWVWHFGARDKLFVCFARVSGLPGGGGLCRVALVVPHISPPPQHPWILSAERNVPFSPINRISIRVLRWILFLSASSVILSLILRSDPLQDPDPLIRIHFFLGTYFLFLNITRITKSRAAFSWLSRLLWADVWSFQHPERPSDQINLCWWTRSTDVRLDEGVSSPSDFIN